MSGDSKDDKDGKRTSSRLKVGKGAVAGFHAKTNTVFAKGKGAKAFKADETYDTEESTPPQQILQTSDDTEIGEDAVVGVVVERGARAAFGENACAGEAPNSNGEVALGDETAMRGIGQYLWSLIWRWVISKLVSWWNGNKKKTA